MDKMWQYMGMGLGVGAVSFIYFYFGVHMFTDKIQLAFKKDSKLMNKIIENTNIKNL